MNMLNPWIDAHHHLWNYDQEEYPWISEDMPGLRRDYTSADLEQLANRNNIAATIAVQARQRIEETAFLLDAARKVPLIAGVVGWVPLTARNVDAHLECYAVDGRLKGVRHVLHDEPDPFYMLRADFNEGIAKLRRYNLRYDVLIFAQHLPQTLTFVDLHPNQIFVINHVAKPRIAEGEMNDWAKGIRELAKRTNVYCKLSGMVTEADRKYWTPDHLKPYFDAVLEEFGPSRLMFGSDWPVLNLTTSYEHWIGIVSKWIGELSDNEANAIRYGTAAAAYHLHIPGLR